MPTTEDCRKCHRTEEIRREMTITQDHERMRELQEQLKAICDECISTLPFVED